MTLCFGTRPEGIKLFPLARALTGHSAAPGVVVRAICTDQHDALLTPVLPYFDGVPLVRLGGFRAGQPLPELAARVLSGLGRIFEEERPDVVVVQGDTLSAYAAAMAAFYLRIAVVHLEAGLRTHDLQQPFPEEFHRTTTARLAGLHLAPTDAAAANLVAEGIASADIVVTGNTGQDAVRLVADAADPPRLDGVDLDAPFGLTTIHRRESAPVVEAIAAGIRAGVRASGRPMVVLTHPNPDVSVPLRELLSGEPGVRLEPPVPFDQMLALLRRARLVLTDSGGVQEEATALGVPVLVARRKTCRPEGVAAGNAVVVGPDATAIEAWIARLHTDDAQHRRMAVPRDTFGDGFAAHRAADAIVARYGRRAS